MRVLTKIVVLVVAGSMMIGGLLLLAGIGCTIPIRKPKPTPPNKQSAMIERLDEDRLTVCFCQQRCLQAARGPGVFEEQVAMAQ